jgi:nucleoside-triphosphatase THEP1
LTDTAFNSEAKVMAPPLKTVWLKAATIGSVWAALEIVLGSFLHNLRIPMAGTVLAGCGVALLVASQMIWREPGLVWRAGVICAIMKSVSPSAVILGPMIGILTEALVIQGCISLLGRNRIALLIGGMLALLEPAIHRVASWIIEYGLDAGVLYVRLYDFVARALRVESIGPLDLVAGYFLLNMLIGLAAVMAGLTIAKRALAVPVPELLELSSGPAASLPKAMTQVRYRPYLLLVHFGVMIGGFMLIRRIPVWSSAVCVAAYSAVCLGNYRTIRRIFRRPKLWIELLTVGVLASLLLGNLSGGESGWSWEGLGVGLQMAMRAILVTIAFASIGTELRNPVIVDWFIRRKWGTLSAATNLAFQALPTMLAALNEQKQALRHPVRAIAQVLATGIRWLDAQTALPGHSGLVFLITGETGSGKTSRLIELAKALRADGRAVAGVVAPVVREAEQRIGYDVVDISTGERQPLCRVNDPLQEIRVGPFGFDPAGFRFGEIVLQSALNHRAEVIVLDEIGPLEQSGQGWSHCLERLLAANVPLLILSVRPAMLVAIERHWKISPAVVWKADQISLPEMLRDVNERVWQVESN